MKRLATVLGLLWLAAAAPFSGHAAAQDVPGGEVPGHLGPPERVADRIHVMRQPDRLWSAVVGNVVIVEQSDGIVLIDSGGTLGDGARVVRAVRQLSALPVKAVAITHWHNDHPLGLGSIRAAWPNVRIIATDATRRAIATIMSRNVGLLRNDPRLDTARLNRSWPTIHEYEASARDPALSEEERREYAIEARYVRARLREQMGAYIVLPTQTFRSRLLLEDPVAPVELRFLGRANTDGDLVAWLPRQRVIATGDIVVAPVPYGFNAYPADWIEVLESIKALGFLTLIPGHGPVQSDASYVDRMIGSLRDVRAQVALLAARGMTLEEVQAAVNYDDQLRAFAGDSLWARLWLRGYWLEPITASAWREARGEPQRPGGG